MDYEDEVAGGTSEFNRIPIENLCKQIEGLQNALERASSKMPEPKKVESFSESVRDTVNQFCQLLENQEEIGDAFAREELSRKKEELKEMERIAREKMGELEEAEEKIKKAFLMKKNTLRALHSLQFKLKGSKDRLKLLELEEFDQLELPESTEDIFKLSDEIELYLQKFAKLVERNFRKMNEFTQLRAQFTEEFEQETRELEQKWQEIERKKEEVKSQMNEDKDNMYKILDEEHERIRNEKESLRKEWSALELQKKEIDSQVRKLQAEENNLRSQMKYELDNFETMKKTYEEQLVNYKRGLEEVEDIKLRQTEEYKETHLKLGQEKKLYKELTVENEKLKKMKEELEAEELRVLEHISEIKREEQTFSKQLNETKAQMQRLDYEFRGLVDKVKLEESLYKQTTEKVDREITEKRGRLALLEETLKSKEGQMKELEKNMENYDVILGEYKAAKENYKKQLQENTKMKKEVEERRYYLEELSVSVAAEEEKFMALKKRAESLAVIFNDRQQQLIDTEEQLAKNTHEISEHEQKLSRMMSRYSTLLEDLKRTESEADVKSSELAAANKKLAEINKDLRDREESLQSMDLEVERKIREMNEFHQALRENEENYSNILMKNRENLETMKEEIESKEAEIKNLTDLIEARRKEKALFDEKSDSYIKELRTTSEKILENEAKRRQKESELAKIGRRLEELSREEQRKEGHLRALISQESELESRCDELEKYIQELQYERDEIMNELKPSALKYNSQLIKKTILDSGEKLNEKSQRKIKDLTESYYEAKDLRRENEKLKNQNDKLIRKLSENNRILVSTQDKAPIEKGKKKFKKYPEVPQDESSGSKYGRNSEKGSEKENAIEGGSLFLSPKSTDEKNELSDWEVMHHRQGHQEEYLNEESRARRTSGNSFEQIENEDDNLIEESKREFYQKMEQVESQINFLQKKSLGSL